MLSLHCCSQAFSNCGERGLPCVEVHRRCSHLHETVGRARGQGSSSPLLDCLPACSMLSWLSTPHNLQLTLGMVLNWVLQTPEVVQG